MKLKNKMYRSQGNNYANGIDTLSFLIPTKIKTDCTPKRSEDTQS
jgi:hypothetical protein